MPEYKNPTHTFVKQGVYYFSRRVPNELNQHYTSKKICHSLRTRSSKVAAARAFSAASKLDEYWYHLRCQDTQLPGRHLLRLNPSQSSTWHCQRKNNYLPKRRFGI